MFTRLRWVPLLHRLNVFVPPSAFVDIPLAEEHCSYSFINNNSKNMIDMLMVAKMKIENEKQKLLLKEFFTHDIELKFGSISDLLFFSAFPPSEGKITHQKWSRNQFIISDDFFFFERIISDEFKIVRINQY